ncbi:glycosyl transferase [Ochrobactrum sp. MYb15]|uniref:glycosyltransferase family 25 protein n=1 Tax=Brucella TaxID=234 RepID=UPI0004650279|nr:glycosyltransferase family 25 protein [Brucella rhizosphaerae]PQZ49330.1 glycosyl transferase [Ochrobactrum sp. MYb19]PRA57450.1 glycosyl transferase [Ochrobactrum sp. MYb68]PRA66852.1 glycosyl transferase [Ochrobactrum sp. MYb18]PRA76118.1 glycosyl transferase [Brucella thiophenivorans]PRA91862.1 glycosyl transferase [Ochrobactrum sp. MYb14]PRA98126.1 glycosyl transferase [Ochrobactrum sp. MYb15]
MNIKAFIIHLTRATDRKPQVDKLIHELPVKTEVIDAVDSRTLTDAEIGRVYKHKLHAPRYPFELSKNEIACFLSHRKAWQAIVDQQLDAGFVIEDDIELTDVFNAAFHAVSNHFEPGSFVRFTFRDDREDGREVFRNNEVRIIIPNPIGLGMVAQLVSFDAAKKLLAITERFDRPVDTTIQMRWVTDLQPLAVIPGGVKEISAQLGGTTIQHKKSLSDKLKREIMRPIYRMRVRGFSSRSK